MPTYSVGKGDLLNPIPADLAVRPTASQARQAWHLELHGLQNSSLILPTS